MIDKTEILQTLQRLDTEFNDYISDPEMPIFFSKLAVMEFCGWIEMSFDSILKDYIQSHIVDDRCKKIIEGFIRKNSGFAYETNTFQIFSIVLGANNWENILDVIPAKEKVDFKNTLQEYSEIRNVAAHTNTAGTTSTYKAPSEVIKAFQLFLPAIQKIETEVRKLPL